jgi:hypothetical protein
MQQGSNAGAGLAARTAGMTDEQILDLDLAQFAAAAPEIAPEAAGEPDLWDMPTAPTSSSSAESGPTRGLSAHETSLSPESAVMRTAFPGSTNPAQGAPPSAMRPTTPNAQGEPAWLKQLEAQPAAAAEARQWREAASDVAALDAAYFSGDPGARGGLAARLYESDPAAFREMLAESARMLAARDPQALGELARQLGMSETQAQNAPAKSLAQAARAQDPAAAAQNPATGGLRGNVGNDASTGASAQAGFPAEAYRTFESATNQDVARQTREAIDRTLSSTLPEGVSEGARRRIGDDVFRELHATLSSDRELGRQVGEILGGWRFDGATKQQIVSLISGRARAAMPEVARRVVGEWTSSVLASDRARAARVDGAASRRDITGGRLPEPVPASALRPRNIDYSRMSDEQILDL